MNFKEVIKNKKVINFAIIIWVVLCVAMICVIGMRTDTNVTKEELNKYSTTINSTAIVENISEVIETAVSITETIIENTEPKEVKNEVVNDIEIEEVKEIEENIEGTEYSEEYEYSYYSPSDLQYQGVIYWNGWKWTWYSERVLPGGGLNIPGRYTDADGFVCDEDGYICLASSTLSKGTVVETLFGRMGKVYDCGCASDVLDVYVNW